MTATLTQVRQALKTRLDTITGLSVYAFPPGTVTVPAAVITPQPGEFLTYRTSNVSHDLDLVVTVFVQHGDDQSATEELDAYLADSGSQSIYLAVESGQTLGGVVDCCAVTGARNHGTFTFGEVQYYGVELAVEVLL
jgi:hypothetical protein